MEVSVNNFVLGIIGNDYIATTNFINKIVNNTDVQSDQEHIKMNIVINNKLLNNKKSLKNTLKKLEDIGTNYLCLTCYNKDIYDYVKLNTNMNVLNSIYNEDEESLIEKILSIKCGDFV